MAPANTAAISGQSISSTAFNTLETDIGTEITNSVDRGGRSAMTAALPMGAQKITGMADPTNPTDGATKNYVDTTTATFFGTGDVKLTFKTTADTGWSIFGDHTIGNVGSGAAQQNVQLQALFTLFFNNISDAAAPIFTSGGGATTRAAQTNAATAWAALCSISLPKALGRALAIAGAGSGLTARALGSTIGGETVVLGTTNLPPYTPAGTIANGAITTTPTANSIAGATIAGVASGGLNGVVNAGAMTLSSAQATSTFTGTPQGGTSTGVSIMQPTTFLNAMVKW